MNYVIQKGVFMNQIMPVNVGFAPRQREMPSRPWVIDETPRRTRNPQEVMNERMKERILNEAKNKPDEERTFWDYLVLGKDKLDKMMENSVLYMA